MSGYSPAGNVVERVKKNMVNGACPKVIMAREFYTSAWNPASRPCSPVTFQRNHK
jgi:hypothetical protein